MAKNNKKKKNENASTPQQSSGEGKVKGADILFTLGIFLVLMTMDSGILGYVLLFVGNLLMLVSIEAVQSNNGWFKAAFISQILGIALYIILIVINASVASTELQAYLMIRGLISNLALVSVFICLYFGVRKAAKAQNKTCKSAFLIAGIILFLYYGLMYVTVFVEIPALSVALLFGGFAVAIAVIVLSFFGWKGIREISSQMRISYGVPQGIVFALLGVVGAVVAGFVCHSENNRLNGEYEKVMVSESNKKVQEDLEKMGLPEDLVRRINDKEIEKYQGATAVTKLQKQSDSNDPAQSQTTSVIQEDVDIYSVTLSDQSRRILVFYRKPDSEKAKRYREGLLLGVESKSGIELTDVYGSNSYEEENLFYEDEYQTLEKNTTLDERMKDKGLTYKNEIQDEKDYSAGSQMKNILAVSSRCKDAKKEGIGKKGGYLAFTVSGDDYESQEFKLYFKYATQSGSFNYPYADMEEYLFKYTDGTMQSKINTLPRQIWEK